MVNLKINGQPISVPEGTTILEAAQANGIDIPTLCYLKDASVTGSCRMCVVEIVGARALQAACVYPVAEGIEVLTHSPKVKAARKSTLELILSNHDRKCLTCSRNQKCELQKLADELGVTDIAFEGVRNEYEIDASGTSIVRDNNKCVLCRRCINVCKNVQTVGVIDAQERGFATKIGCAFEANLADTACVNCGQCITACPVGALHEKYATDEVFEAIADPDKYVVNYICPGRLHLVQTFRTGKQKINNARAKAKAAAEAKAKKEN